MVQNLSWVVGYQAHWSLPSGLDRLPFDFEKLPFGVEKVPFGLTGQAGQGQSQDLPESLTGCHSPNPPQCLLQMCLQQQQHHCHWL